MYMGGQYFLYTLHKKPSPELSGFHHPSPIQGCSKSETHRKSGRLAGTWRGLKGAGGWEHHGWAGLGWSAQPAAGEALSTAPGTSIPFYLRAEEISQLLPPPPSREMGTDVPHWRNARQLRQKLESSV